MVVYIIFIEEEALSMLLTKDSTDGRHKAIRLSSLEPEKKSLPALQSNPISPLPISPSALLRQAPNQYLKESMLSSTSFGLPGHQHSLTRATLEEWLLFCNQCHCNVIGYSEGGAYPALSRRDFANAQMRSGSMILFLTDNGYLLAPAKIAVLTCADLARELLWDTALCCPECHDLHHDSIEFFLTNHDFMEGKRGKRSARGCCRAERLVNDFYVGKVFSPGDLDTHGDDDDSDDSAWGFFPSDVMKML